MNTKLYVLLAAGVLQLAFPATVKPPAPAELAVRAAGARSPWRDGPMMVVFGLMFLLNLVTFQLASTFPLALRDLYGFSEARIGLTYYVTRWLDVSAGINYAYDPTREAGMEHLLLPDRSILNWYHWQYLPASTSGSNRTKRNGGLCGRP